MTHHFEQLNRQKLAYVISDGVLEQRNALNSHGDRVQRHGPLQLLRLIPQCRQQKLHFIRVKSEGRVLEDAWRAGQPLKSKERVAELHRGQLRSRGRDLLSQLADKLLYFGDIADHALQPVDGLAYGMGRKEEKKQ